MGNGLKPLTKEEIASLIAVARREKPASAWIRNGVLANVYTGELQRVHIAIDGRRIAYVGAKEPKADQHTRVIDGTGYILMPGYIEPHAHPFQLYHPITLADYALSRGTTTYIGDNMVFFHALSLENWLSLMEAFARHPVKILWWSRLDPQSSRKDLWERYDPESLQTCLKHPLVLQGGELTHWMPLLHGDREMAARIAAVKEAGKRLEGHAPGASEETLNALAVAGITSDHEGINGEEVLRRLRLGMYAPLRHSSIRPDLPVLIQGLRDLSRGWERLMLTTDGSTPPFLEKGFTDFLIRLAIENGVPPFDAYRMATLNVAAYYGLDEQLGGIAPGRLADILFLESLENPTPVKVMAEGKLLVSRDEGGEGEFAAGISIPWEDYGLLYRAEGDWRLSADHFRIPWEAGKPFPVLHLLNDVITVRQDVAFPVKDGFLDVGEEGFLYAALVDRRGQWITRGVLSHFAPRLEALASTYTVSGDYLVIGRDVHGMAVALDTVRRKSGICIVEKGSVAEHLPLPILGSMTDLPMPRLIQRTKELCGRLKEKGYAYGDPFYCLLFLSSTHLPKLRLTEEGILSVKENEILIPSQRL